MRSFSEADLRVLHAVQLAPRASWAQIAQVLGVDPATVARRWARLATSGSAWLSAHPGPGAVERVTVSFVEVDCATDQMLPIADALARDPRVGSVEHVTGGRDLLLTVFTAGLDALSDFVLHGVSRIPGVRSIRSQVGTRLFVEGSKWQLRTLEPAEQRRLARSVSTSSASASAPAEADLRAVLRLLAENGRMGVSELADRMGVSRPTARRRVEAVLASRAVVVRCDVPHALTGWPVSVTLWADVPPEEHGNVARTLAGLPETRVCLGLTGGAANLVIALWLRGLDDVQRLESVLAERVPRLRFVDRAVALRHTKRAGTLLGPDGRAAEQVPIDPWFRD
ncbi:AsnC family transcriptional regulator [Streptomyces sp. NPDC046909]|uniref:Lrp/AsnC family transcriptional regulator n=1 Tax=Streptomyces sp. NPDC046909 TaxID=3155617 RepID=UPI00340A76C0